MLHPWGGVVGGAVVFIRTVPPMTEIVTQASLANSGNEAYVRYRYGTYPVAKTALLKYVDELRSSSSSSATGIDETGAFSVGLAYARLALTAERTANAEEAGTYMNLAKEAFSRQRHPYDETKIRSAVDRIDKAWDQSLALPQK